MPTTFEHIQAEHIYLLRSGAEHKNFGDPYTVSMICLVNGRTAELKGGYGRFMDIQGIKAAGKQIGIERITWERCLSGVLIPHTMTLTKE
jgi:hypothetical protein